ncbi:hypothetical protein [Achromobacter mucicolens]|uniref:hypothetical protein n=1 Tax=Achromobacter mucicolens TaxID=1389922 RepID=UPI002FE4230D
MSIYVVTAVRRDPVTGEISRLSWAQVDAQGGGRIPPSEEVDAILAVDEIEAGNDVVTWHGAGEAGQRGRALRIEVQGNAVEVLRDDPADGRYRLGLEDLPQF